MPVGGWGDPGHRTGLPPQAKAWLRRLGVRPPAGGPRTAAAPVLRPSGLDDAALAALRAVVDVSTADDERAAHARGKSYLDLLDGRSGALADAPDAVLLPTDGAQIAAVFEVCSAHAVAVVPFGGGTSVVGGVHPLRGRFAAVVSLDLRRMDRLLAVDEVSRTATFQPGVRGPAAEALLAAHGLTLGHLPQSFEFGTVGGFAATRGAGQASSGYGRFDDLVLGLAAVTPAGTLRTGRGAASAAGPDLRALLLGSEGSFGVLTEITVRVRPAPLRQHYEGWLLPSFEAGQTVLRGWAQDGGLPDVVRLSDPDETAVNLSMAAGGAKGLLQKGFVRLRGGRSACLLVLGWDTASATDLRARRRAAHAGLAAAGAAGLGAGAGAAWARGRFHGPYLRDDLMDAGVLVETLETSATWSELAGVYAATRAALMSALPGAVLMTHLSHVYPQGASIYVTVLAAASPADPAGQWRQAKVAATEAILASGGTLTHHHAVGADHQPWMTQEVGDLGVDVLRAVKSVLDPDGLLNPGKLMPDA